MAWVILIILMQARFECKCRKVTRGREREEGDGGGNDDDDDEKRSSWIEGIRKLSQRWKDRRPSRHDPCSHGRQSESNFWCGLLAPREIIVHLDRWMQLRTRDNYFPGAQYLSQLDIRFIDIFSQSFERLYLLLYNVVYLALVSCCSRDYPPCFGPRRTLVDQIGGG